ncbi:MAG: DUF3179 domain-containing (seleno)protein [Pseudomonadota bacterium]|nr:DUF3179 domain-containing (seleno)protein [Pseudomonadota bacterium]
MSNSGVPDRVTWVLVALSLAVALFLVALFTELGQLMNLPSSWLYAAYPYLGTISIVLMVVAAYVLFRHLRGGFMSRRTLSLYLIALVGMILVVNYFVPYIWLRGHHHTAEFISVAEADPLLDDDEDVFVLTVGDEARAYPRDWMMIPHIAGDTVGGEDVVMTYCVLTNLPMVFDSDIDGQPANLKVVSQAHNNLVMTDTNSGELFQQITATAPASGKTLSPRAGQRMPWRSFKALYPDGKVFRVVESAPWAWIDAITYKAFTFSLDSHYNGPDPLFPTLRMDDDRLPAKEQIWGVSLGGEQVAYTRDFLESQPVYNTTVGGEPVVVAWFPEYETVGVFSRRAGGSEVEVSGIDVYGNTPDGKLERLPQYPHVFWMVWSHWFPETEVMA